MSSSKFEEVVTRESVAEAIYEGLRDFEVWHTGSSIRPEFSYLLSGVREQWLAMADGAMRCCRREDGEVIASVPEVVSEPEVVPEALEIKEGLQYHYSEIVVPGKNGKVVEAKEKPKPKPKPKSKSQESPKPKSKPKRKPKVNPKGKRGRRQKLTDVDRSELCAKYRSGLTMRELSECYGVSSATVDRVLTSYGVAKRCRGASRVLTVDQEEAMVREYGEGVSQVGLKKSYGVGLKKVKEVLENHGVRIRGRGRHKKEGG